MPTGYTADIISGKIKTFKEFAWLCTRGFGASLHMRDESMDAMYEKPKVSDHYSDKVEEIRAEINRINSIDDIQLEAEVYENLINERERLEDTLIEKNDKGKRIRTMLIHACSYVPPSEDHRNYKDFMIDQLKTTLDHDGDNTYTHKALDEIFNKLERFNVERERISILADLHKDHKYYTESLEKEHERVNNGIEWMEDVAKSLDIKIEVTDETDSETT